MRGPPDSGGPLVRLEAGRPPTRRISTQRRIESSAPVFLIGLPGAGKTAAAPLLAARLGRRWEDLDALVARAAARSVPDLLTEEGEERFRAREAAALRGLLESGAEGATASRAPEGAVIACGGGVVVGAESRALLAAASAVVWLRVAPETAWARLGREGAATRPLLSGGGPRGTAEAGEGVAAGGLERLRALHAAREPLYEAIAAVRVETDDRSPEEVAAAAEAALRERWAGSAS